MKPLRSSVEAAHRILNSRHLKVLSREFTSGKRKLPVVYEDKDVIFINKPTGMLSQKAKPEDISANEYILAYLIAKGELTESSFRTSAHRSATGLTAIHPVC